MRICAAHVSVIAVLCSSAFAFCDDPQQLRLSFKVATTKHDSLQVLPLKPSDVVSPKPDLHKTPQSALVVLRRILSSTVEGKVARKKLRSFAVLDPYANRIEDRFIVVQAGERFFVKEKPQENLFPIFATLTAKSNSLPSPDGRHWYYQDANLQPFQIQSSLRPINLPAFVFPVSDNPRNYTIHSIGSTATVEAGVYEARLWLGKRWHTCTFQSRPREAAGTTLLFGFNDLSDGSEED